MPSVAPIAHAARVMPSITAKGSPSMMLRSMKAPGSPSSALQMSTLWGSLLARARDHLRPVGKPPPPRPRSPDSVTTSTNCSGVISVSTLRMPA